MPSLLDTRQELQRCRVQAAREEFTCVRDPSAVHGQAPLASSEEISSLITGNGAGERKVFSVSALKELVEGLTQRGSVHNAEIKYGQ